MTSRPPFQVLLLPPDHGVAEGEAEGEADSSAAAFFFVLFFAGDAEASAEVEVFFVELFLVVVDAAWVVAVVEVAPVVDSFFAHEPKNAAIVSAVIKAKRDVFIVMVKLNRGRACRVSYARARPKSAFFPS